MSVNMTIEEIRVHNFLNEKTVHSGKSIAQALRAIHAQSRLTPEAHQAFGQKCHNFELLCETTGQNSWGRNQFLEWWNHGTVNGVDPMRKHLTVNHHLGSAELPPMPEIEPIPDARPSYDKWEHVRLSELFSQIDYCDFECQAGPLHLNAAYIELKRRMNILTGGTIE